MNQEQEPNQIALTSPDGKEARLAELRRLFPDLFDGEGALDEKALRQLVSDEAGHITERFRFEWAGKAQSKRFAFAPSKATLVYDPERSVNADGTPSKAGESLQENTSQNLIIEGDNLEVLKLLQASYFEKVKCIYIDPPYNTGNDFIYPDNYTQKSKDYWEKEGSIKGGVKLRGLLETSGRRHSEWLNFMQSRLLIARNLLSSDGVIFASIGEDEIHNLRKLMGEIFGEDNFISIVTRIAKRTSDKGTHFRPTKDYIIAFAKEKSSLNEFGVQKDRKESDYKMKDKDGRAYKKSGASLYQPSLDSRPNQRYYIEAPDGSLIIPPGTVFPNEKRDAAKVKPLSNSDKVWRWSVDSYLKNKDKLIFTKGSSQNPLLDENGNQSNWNIYPKVYFDEDINSALHPEDVIYDFPNSKATKELNKIDIPFSFAKPSELLKFLVSLHNDENGIIMDFFAGSGTLGHAVFKMNSELKSNRKFICIQVPEIIEKESDAYSKGYRTISDITLDRVRKSGELVRSESSTWKGDIGFKALKLTYSYFPQNTFTPDPEKGEAENLKALEDHLQAAAQLRLFGDDGFHSVVTEIALKNGFGLFYTLERQEAFAKNTVYRMQGNNKDAILCLDGELTGGTIEALKAYSDDQLIVLKAALDTTTKFELQTAFKDNLWVI